MILHKADLLGHPSSVYALKKVNDILISAGSGGIVGSWDLNLLKASGFSVNVGKAVYAIEYIKKTNLLLLGTSEGNVHVIDLTKKQEVKNLVLHKLAVFDISYNAFTNTILTVSMDGSLTQIDANTFELVDYKVLTSGKLRKTFFDNELAYICCGDGYIRVYNMQIKGLVYSFLAHELSANVCKKAPTKKQELLFSGGRDAMLNVWKLNGGNPPSKILSIPAHNYAIYDMAISPNQKYLATASRDKTIKIWDVNDLSLVHRIDVKSDAGHSKSVNVICWEEEGLISSGDDAIIKVWDVV